MSALDGSLPGAELVEEGVRDLARGAETVPALLVSIAAPRLIALGIEVPPGAAGGSLELRLYELLRRESPRDAYTRYNALLRRLVSFERAAEQRRARARRAQLRG